MCNNHAHGRFACSWLVTFTVLSTHHIEHATCTRVLHACRHCLCSNLAHAASAGRAASLVVLMRCPCAPEVQQDRCGTLNGQQMTRVHNTFEHSTVRMHTLTWYRNPVLISFSSLCRLLARKNSSVCSCCWFSLVLACMAQRRCRAQHAKHAELAPEGAPCPRPPAPAGTATTATPPWLAGFKCRGWASGDRAAKARLGAACERAC